MNYDKALVAGKLRRWDRFVQEYHLPLWDEIPDIGLYMEQVLSMLKDYLVYLPPELQDDEYVTAATINNYVRKKIMPEPVRKRYYRIHIAYLIMICTLKQSLNISMLSSILPSDLSEEELKKTYELFTKTHRAASLFFCEQAKIASSRILERKCEPVYATDTPEELLISCAVIGNYAKLLSEKLILIDGLTTENGGEIE